MSGTNAHWLDDYGSERFRWRETRNDQQQFFYRPLGHTESLFDSDGRYYEGRADINSMVEMEVKSRLTEEQLHEKILLAWTCLRSRHSLLRASAVKRVDIGLSHDDDPNEYCFRVHVPRDVEEAKDSAKGHIVFLGDHYEAVDTDDFWQGPSPPPPSHCGFAPNLGWNDYLHEQKGLVCDFIKSREIEQHLPLPQEALYPPISGSKAKQRWFWAITRILRHVRKPLQAGFANTNAVLPALDSLLQGGQSQHRSWLLRPGSASDDGNFDAGILRWHRSSFPPVFASYRGQAEATRTASSPPTRNISETTASG
ncbi:hypothetical protein KC322_g61 [Hortaea werneckii]|nr:hypothetical protein KC322_g61 [Hortaea werneckii]